MVKGKKEFPYKSSAFLPAGHPWGRKQREFIRQDFHKTEEAADREVKIWESMGIKCIKTKRK